MGCGQGCSKVLPFPASRSQIRSPKPEIRGKSEIRNPKGAGRSSFASGDSFRAAHLTAEARRTRRRKPSPASFLCTAIAEVVRKLRRILTADYTDSPYPCNPCNPWLISVAALPRWPAHNQITSTVVDMTFEAVMTSSLPAGMRVLDSPNADASRGNCRRGAGASQRGSGVVSGSAR